MQRGIRGRGIKQEEKGLVYMDNSVVIVGEMRISGG